MRILLGNQLAPSLKDSFNACAAHDHDLRVQNADTSLYASSEARAAAPNDIQPGEPVIVINSLARTGEQSANDAFMQFLFLLQALKSKGAGPIWAVNPVFAYAREDRPFERTATETIDGVGLDLAAALMKQTGVSGVSTIEMHSNRGVQILQDNFGDQNVFNLHPTDLYVADIRDRLQLQAPHVGGPDSGANERADAVARALDAERFHFTKAHDAADDVKVTGFDGAVRDRKTVTVDDMICRGGTIDNSQTRLRAEGAEKQYVYGGHPFFSQNALTRLFKMGAIAQLMVLDTIDTATPRAALCEALSGDQDRVDAFLKTLTVGPLLHAHIRKDILSHPLMKVAP